MNSILKLKAKKLYPGPVMIILTSSSLVWVEEDCREKYGEYLKKVDAAIRMEDATFLDVVRHFPEYGTSQAVQVYGIIGGVPGYLTRWNSKRVLRKMSAGIFCLRMASCSMRQKIISALN